MESTERGPAVDEQLTYALIHGGGDVGWAWHRVEAELRARGRRTVAIDLPIEDEQAGLLEQASAVADAVGDASKVVVVGHSFGGFVAPLVADLVPGARLLVFVAGMVPQPGEAPAEWWAATGHAAAEGVGDEHDVIGTYLADVDPELAREALSRSRSGSNAGYGAPWPLSALPDLPTRALLFRQDRFFPPGFMRSVIRARLGIEPDEMDGSHGAMLSRPRELAAYLEGLVAELNA